MKKTETAAAIPETKAMPSVMDAIKNVAEGKEPSLRAFALVLDIPVTRLNMLARRPIVGQVYDPNAKNWDELNKFFVNKITAADAVITTMDDLVKAAMEKDAWLAVNTVSHIATGSNLIDVDGGKMPKRKSAMFEMDSEKASLICLKHDPLVYKMVYQTLGYTCIRAVNEDGSFAREEVRVISNGTLNTKCVPPTTMAQAIADRFSGEYAKQTATATATATENDAKTEEAAAPADAE